MVGMNEERRRRRRRKRKRRRLGRLSVSEFTPPACAFPRAAFFADCSLLPNFTSYTSCKLLLPYTIRSRFENIIPSLHITMGCFGSKETGRDNFGTPGRVLGSAPHSRTSAPIPSTTSQSRPAPSQPSQQATGQTSNADGGDPRSAAARAAEVRDREGHCDAAS